MRIAAVLWMVATTGCFTRSHVSTVGAFVRTIDADRDGLVIESCTLKLTDSTDYDFTGACLGGQATTSHHAELTQGVCLGQFLSLGDPAASTPPRVLP